jgi:hypothetical protein
MAEQDPKNPSNSADESGATGAQNPAEGETPSIPIPPPATAATPSIPIPPPVTAATPSIPIPPPISPVSKGVVGLGVYLILVLLLSVYLLSLMIRGEDPSKTIGEMRKECCGPNNEGCPTPTPAPSPVPTAAPAAGVNTNSNSNLTAAGTNQNTNTVDTNTPNGNRNSNKPGNAEASTNGNTPVKPNSNTLAQDIPEVQIPPYMCVAHFGRMSADGYLFFVVLFAGMLGATVRGIFSFTRHLGIKDFSFSWTWFYILLPFSGAPVSLFLYFVIRGGFYGSPIGKGLVLNLAAFVALGALAGLFSENAMEKLRQVAEVLLTKVPDKTSNPPPPKPPPPAAKS